MLLHAHAVLQRALLRVRLGRRGSSRFPGGGSPAPPPASAAGAVWRARCGACPQAADGDLHSVTTSPGHAFASGSRHSAVSVVPVAVPARGCWGSDRLQSPASPRTRVVTAVCALGGCFPSSLPFNSRVPVLRLLGNIPSAWSLSRIPRPAPGLPPCAPGPSVTQVLALRRRCLPVAVPAGARVSPGAGAPPCRCPFLLPACGVGARSVRRRDEGEGKVT